MRLLNTLLLIFATVAQGVFATPAGWREFDREIAPGPPTPSHARGVARCRCCDCGGSACCALPAASRVPVSDHTAPFKVATAPEGPGAAADGIAADARFGPFNPIARSLAPTGSSLGFLPGHHPPAFLRGGGLLI